MVKNLKKLRKINNISQQRLASDIGISQQSINKYENQKTEPDISTLIKLAEYFDTTVDYLVGFTDEDDLHDYYGNMQNLNKNEHNIINSYRLLDKDQKQIVKMIMDSYQDKK